MGHVPCTQVSAQLCWLQAPVPSSPSINFYINIFFFYSRAESAAVWSKCNIVAKVTDVDTLLLNPPCSLPIPRDSQGTSPMATSLASSSLLLFSQQPGLPHPAEPQLHVHLSTGCPLPTFLAPPLPASRHICDCHQLPPPAPRASSPLLQPPPLLGHGPQEPPDMKAKGAHTQLSLSNPHPKRKSLLGSTGGPCSWPQCPQLTDGPPSTEARDTPPALFHYGLGVLASHPARPAPSQSSVHSLCGGLGGCTHKHHGVTSNPTPRDVPKITAKKERMTGSQVLQSHCNPSYLGD
jgi:hypothetical protein